MSPRGGLVLLFKCQENERASLWGAASSALLYEPQADLAGGVDQASGAPESAHSPKLASPREAFQGPSDDAAPFSFPTFQGEGTTPSQAALKSEIRLKMKGVEAGYTCNACRSHFRSSRARDRFCLSCRHIVEAQTDELESLLSLWANSPRVEVRTEARQAFYHSLVCPMCGWDGNRNRTDADDPRVLFVHARRFAVADLKHRMKHAFPGRFLRWSRKLRRYQSVCEAYLEHPIPRRAARLAEAIRALGFEPYPYSSDKRIQLPPF